MRTTERLLKLEARLRPTPTRYPAPALVSYVHADGECLEAFAIDQLLNSWPLTVERQWLRETGEDMGTFAARVIAQARPGALLVCANAR